MAKRDLSGIKKLADLTAEDIDAIGEDKGKQFANSIKTNQVRNIYSSVIALRVKAKLNREFNELKRDLILLKPKMAYAAGRQQVVRPFYDFVSSAIAATNDEKDLNNFIKVMEAIVAYHKFYGGKDK